MSNTQTKNVPELRFPGFEGEWEEKELGEIFQIISGSTPLKSNKEFYENGNINWVKTTDLNNSKVTHSKEKITEYAMKSLKLKLVPKNSVLIAMYGGFNQIGRTGLLKIDATINQAISALLMNHETNPEFIQAFLNYQVKGWKRYAASSRKDPNITKKDIEQFKVPYVSINEQQKIGEFFSKIDHQIELEEQKLELLQQQKKGYMQKIFSQELRFKDENGEDYPDWEVTTIQNITKYTSSKKSSNQYADKDNSKGYPVYDAVQEIGKDSNYDIEESYISILKDGAGVGRLNLRPGKSSVIGTMGYIQSNNVDIEFLYYRMKVVDFKKYIIGSTIPHLYFKDYSKETLYIPSSIQEQAKIGMFISNLDKLIENKNLKLNCLKQLKQGLLQSMFI
ncbi:TPA: restriction endonuclease subunit S [Staphylococcus argenteus]|uniref:restriction endonuclease subunit S n=1 Tax=Staphylococcus argenteus TaxID=985002 RepID=UPI00023400C9|nr:restriction endonuclease subunit S [Staphylococcus argenteus]MBE2132288.1 restriction endonuclease subunit S [Staphylococcus argenteus]PNY92394.1 restriction endonuclease subunit S [Staphylococcus argenteus]CCE58232.1 putative restriction and modification system specificity protein [Staphylococcus argenteus]SUJ03639.1 putative restriction and modification system specificity protein [Staphylococcus argenteus]HDY9430247.1 restriction endonuclease subunit S [Staphylococcus argenteus]